MTLPRVTNLPDITREWINTISRICRQITGKLYLNSCFFSSNLLMSVDVCKATKKDISNRKEILQYLQSEFGKCYPSCCIHAYGSSDNGFGLRQSDLDVCVELNDNVCSLTFHFFN